MLLVSPILLSLAVTFDYINSQLHAEYRRFRGSMARQRGTQVDTVYVEAEEVKHTPWEDDSSHTR